jgi:FkbM family methyltransferase
MLRIQLISYLVQLNELIVFYPKLKSFYKGIIGSGAPTIIDVGANKGQSIDFFLSVNQNCKIYAFEPNPTLYTRLVRKYGSRENIKLFNLGVSNSNGQLLFHENMLDETSTFEELNYDSEYLKTKSRVLGVKPENIIAKSYPVEVVTLSEFLRMQAIEQVDVLKLDTEGHEYKCLQGLLVRENQNVRYIQLEQHFDDMYAHAESFDRIIELLAKAKYAKVHQIKHGFGDFHEVIFKQK